MDNPLTIHLGQLVQHVQDAAILVMDLEGNILHSSLGVKRSYGYEEEELQGKNFSFLFIPEDRGRRLPEIEVETARNKGAVSDNNYLMHKNGAYIWSHGETTLIKHGTGSAFLVKMIYDINQQKLLEKSLLTSNKKLTRVNKDLDTFVYTASHDLKAPISNLEGLFEMLKEEINGRKFDKVPDIFELIDESLKNFKNTLDELADTAREKAGTGNKDGEVHLIELLEEIKTSLREEIETSQAVFIEDFAEVPSIRIEARNIRSVLFNLISNGIKFRSPDRRPEIRIMSRQQDQYVLLVVQDNGIGMREEQKGKVFEIFQRLNDEIEGSGVGLNIVKQIVENHGGKVEIESEQGKGSTFKVYLPYTVEDVEQNRQPEAPVYNR